MRGDLGGARAGGLLLVVIAACISIPMDAPLLALGLSIVPGAWWHLYPMAVPSASSFADRAGSCLHDARQVSVPGTANVIPPPHPHSTPASAPVLGECPGFSSEPILRQHHENPSQPGGAQGCQSLWVGYRWGEQLEEEGLWGDL